MWCGIYPMLGALLSSYINVNIEFLGTTTKNGYQAVYPEDAGAGKVNITLPDILYTLNASMGWVNETENMTILDPTAYRLNVHLPSGIQIEVDWSSVELHPAIIPVNLTLNDYYGEGFMEDYSTVSLNFIVNDTYPFDVMNESLDMSISFDWGFVRAASPGLYDMDVNVELTPYDWDYINLNTTVNGTSLLDLILNNNITVDYPQFDPFWLEDNSTSMYNITHLQECTFVDEDFKLLSSWTNATECTRCVTTNRNFSVYGGVYQEVVLIRPDLTCATSVSPTGFELVAGSTVTLDFEILHATGSNDEALSTSVELNLLDSSFEFEFNRTASSSINGTGAIISSISTFSFNGSYFATVQTQSVDDDSIIISIILTIRDDVVLGSGDTFTMLYSYEGRTISGGLLRYADDCSVYLETQSISTVGRGGSISLPTLWGIEVPFVARFEFSMPPGTLPDCEMKLDFEVDMDNGSQVPVEIVDSIIETSHNDVIIEQREMTAEDFRRKKRAVTRQFVRPIGTIVNPATGAGPATVTVNMKFIPTSAAMKGLRITASGTFGYAALVASLGNATTTIAIPDLEANKVYQREGEGDIPELVKVTVTVDHTPHSTGAAYNVRVSDFVPGFTVQSQNVFISPQNNISLAPTAAGSGMIFTVDDFTVGDPPIVLSYLAKADELTAGGTFNMNGTVTYQTAPKTVALYKYGITGGAAVGGFLVGIIIVAILAFVIITIMKKKQIKGYGMLVHPESATDYAAITRQRKSHALLLDARHTFKQELGSAMVGLNDSIVAVLAMGDKLKVNRELDNLDIQATVEIDEKMEKERLDAMVLLMESLLGSLLKNNDISRQQYDGAIKQFKIDLKNLDTSLTKEYEKALTDLITQLAWHNRGKLGHLMDQQREYKEKQLESIDIASPDQRKEFLELIDVQLQTEQDNLSYKLKLEQDEEREKLRKEFALRKRIQSKECQQYTLQNLKTSTNMTEEQAAWLLKEHARNQSKLEKLHDDEMSRQRIVLEKKLAKRRAFAELSETQDRNQSELLNTLAGGQIDILKKAKKSKYLSVSEAREMSEVIMRDLTTYKQGLETDQQKQEAALQSRLSKAKKQRLEAKEKEMLQKLADFEKNCKQQQADGTLDPVSVTQTKLELISTNETDMSELETQIDEENAAELKELRERITQTTKTQLRAMETKQLNDLKKDGMRDDQIQAILSQHDDDVSNLEAILANQYKAQEENLKMRLRKRKKEWAKKQEQEKEEKTQLRAQEEEVVAKLVTGQLSMSEEERDRILKEHEKNMVRLENSLTLNKLQQRKIFEKKLADRRAKRMEALQQKQLHEKKKLEKQTADEDEEDQEVASLELKKQQAEERVAVLAEEDEEVDLEEEMERVRLEMMQQRAVTLREQEDKLGSMVAQLQLNKAKEIAEIEDKQRAINELKANLIDDLAERGVMSDIEAEECIENHRAQQEKLSRKLDAEKEKQEKALKKKLALRLQQRENTLLESYETRLQETLAKSPNKIAGKLRKAVLMQKRMMEMEEFKARMEKEISQTLEETRRQHNVRKTKLIQELEIRFISSLIKQGRLKRSELKDCLKMLFPGKSDQQLEILINSLHDQNSQQQSTDSEEDELNTSTASMLRERIQRSVSLYQSNLEPIDENGSSKKKRPKTGRKKSAVDPLDYNISEQPNRNKLPPLKSAGKRKPQPNSASYEDL